MELAGRHPALDDLDATVGLDAVRATLLNLGKSDSAFLHRAVNTLFEATPDLLRPTAVMLLADVLGSPADRGAVRFAAALQCVVAATSVHRAGPHGAPDHLEVLAGDYLYAQAAVLTSGLNNLAIMAGLSGAIKMLCRNGLDNTAPRDLKPLFELGAEAVTLLLVTEPARAASIVGFGRLLDHLGVSHDASGAGREARRSAAQFASGRDIARLGMLAELVARSTSQEPGTAPHVPSVAGNAGGKD